MARYDASVRATGLVNSQKKGIFFRSIVQFIYFGRFQVTFSSSNTNTGKALVGSGIVFALLLTELILINGLRHYFGFECHEEDLAFCSVARHVLLAAYGILATLVLLALFARRQILQLLSDAGLCTGPLLANIAGLALLAATLPALRSDLSAVGIFLLAAA